jgi:hypothetical protein
MTNAARLNCISYILDTIEYKDVLRDPIGLPPRPKREDDMRPPRGARTEIIGKY